jgi:hypothetical protein
MRLSAIEAIPLGGRHREAQTVAGVAAVVKYSFLFPALGIFEAGLPAQVLGK